MGTPQRMLATLWEQDGKRTYGKNFNVEITNFEYPLHPLPSYY